ncbi:Phage terminase, large subunit GpA [Azotobacter beijerinckii]|uniref:Phage terminase, large subunit GpA n=1 Tax=Azotobacter beijerinckii TaxID=170623 RepID=A0A1H9JWP7_9GAMM|nr:terminase gpA endonuclease subunit [Azotobacter beijerinckii]SEQ90965.1 Phage terminase, large subunit GpA [Azotobacter beijerinckii]
MKTADIVRNTAEIIRPPRRILVSDAAEQNLKLNEPGGYQGDFTLDVAPYMREPMDLLSSRRFEGVVFVGPARSLKTQALIDGGFAYTVTCDPGDALIVQMSQESARDFSRTRIDRAIRYSPELASRIATGRADDNVFDKFFKSGMVLKIGWPAVSQLSSKSIRWVWLTDYDRMDDDIDGEGDAWSLALKRTQTFLSRGMCCAESSPGREMTDPAWRRKTPHEGPPCKGIVGLYNMGDRRRWYWQCPDCKEFSEPAPGIGSFALPSMEQLKEQIRTADLTRLTRECAYFACPHCGSLISEKHKRAMNRAGLWLIEGQQIDRDRTISGEPRQSKVASFWLGGMAAAFQGWESIVGRYLQGMHAYVTTGDEEMLKTTTNLDQGAPYMPQRAESVRSQDLLIVRKEEVIKFQVPDGVRFITVAVDVQAGGKPRFVVQVEGWGAHGENWLIDRYNIRTSKRLDEDGQPLPVDPAAYLEDWDLLEEVMQKAYPLADGSGRAMLPVMVACDSGGKAGVTERAYDYWRKLKRAGLHKRFMLIKGDGAPNAPRLKETYPDSDRKDRKAKARGEIPVWRLNTNMIKDAVDADLQREAPGHGYRHFPEWLGDWFFEEMTFEVRTPQGWKKPGKGNNEAFDLSGYNRAAAIRQGMEKIDWSSPPPWARDWNNNPNVIQGEPGQVAQPRPIDPPKPKPQRTATRRVRMQVTR